MKYLNRFFFLIALIFIIVFFILQSAFDKGININEKYPVLDDAVMNVMYKLSMSHLFLEEVLSGDKAENIENALSLMDEAQHYSRMLLEDKYKGVFQTQNSDGIETIILLNKNLGTLQTLSLKRYQASDDARAGSASDIEYDYLFKQTLQYATDIEKYIHREKEKALDDFILLKYILYIILLFIVASSLYYTYRSNKKYVLKQENLVETQTKLNKSIGLLGENVITSTADLKGFITDVSNALCKISGYSREELLGKPHSLFRHPNMDSKVYEDLWKTIQQEKAWSGEIKNLKKNGDFYWVRAFISPLYDANNKHIGYSSIRHDITPNKAKDEFMANMSHELRTPLNSIIGFSSILNKKQTDPSHKELSKQIYTSSRSLLSLINNILDLSKIQNSKFTIEPYEFCAYTELVEFSNHFEGLTVKKTLYFNSSFDKNLKAVFMGDWTRINQIILNLISNAVKFTPRNGEINVIALYEKGNFVICVEDTGIGMSKAVQDKIFQPFEQADGSTTRKYGGTGLGLSITQALVEMMHGTIELESTENVGTKFRVILPLEKLRDSDAICIVEEEEEFSKENTLWGNVLVAEDNKTNQMLIKMLLEDFGLTCDIANDGIEATNMFDPHKHKLILMDENMPNMNGIEAMKIIKKKFSHEDVIVIALTANAMENDREKFLQAGMNEYISKPIDEDALYQALKEFLQ